MEQYKELQNYAESVRRAKYMDDNDHHHKGNRQAKLDIGGRHFSIAYSSMKSIPNSLLSQLHETSEYYNKTKRMYIIDRDPDLVTHIISAHREGELHVPKNVCVMRFKREMKFWGIPHHLLSPCCWKQYFELNNDLDTLNTLLAYKRKQRPIASVDTVSANSTPIHGDTKSMFSQKGPSLKDRIWVFLDEPSSSSAAKIWCLFYLLVVTVSAIVFIVWLYPGVRVDPYLHSLKDYHNLDDLNSMSADLRWLTTHNSKVTNLIFTDPHIVLFVLDTFCTGYFLSETAVHFIVCPDKKVYVKSLFNMLKVILCISMLITYVFELRKDLINSIGIVYCYLIFKSINSLRLLLLFRLQKLYNGLHIMCLAVERSFRDLMLLLFALCIAVAIYGGLIFSMEIETEMFPDTITSMWWALITMTTVGYGDFYPTSELGYSVGFLCALNGLIIIALPIATIASSFSDLYARYMDYTLYTAAMREDDEQQMEEDMDSVRTGATTVMAITDYY